jgi:hypothetical protein
MVLYRVLDKEEEDEEGKETEEEAAGAVEGRPVGTSGASSVPIIAEGGGDGVGVEEEDEEVGPAAPPTACSGQALREDC